MKTRWMRWGMGFVASALVLTACADDGDGPGPDATGAETSQPTAPVTEDPTGAEPGPGPTPWPEPTRPAAMERDDLEGAKAAAEYFLALYPYVFATGDLGVWEEMSHRDCQFCSGTAERVKELFSEGGYAIGGDVVVEDIGVSEPDEDWPHYRVGVVGAEQPSVEYTSAGEVIAEFPGGAARYNFAVITENGSWTVRGVAVEGASE